MISWAQLVVLAEEIARNIRMPAIRTLGPEALMEGEPNIYTVEVTTDQTTITFTREPSVILIDNTGSHNLYVSTNGISWKTIEPSSTLVMPAYRRIRSIALIADGDTTAEIVTIE